MLLSLFSPPLKTQKPKLTTDKQFVSLGFCRKEATRTPDPYVPNVVRYQLRYFPILRCKVK